MAGVSIEFNAGSATALHANIHPPATRRPPRYLQLHVADRAGVEGLKDFCHAAGTHDEAARILSNRSIVESFVTAAPLAVADFLAMWILLSASIGLTQQIIALPAGFPAKQASLLASLLLIPIAHLAGVYPGIGISPVVEFRQLVRAAGLSLFAFAVVSSVLLPQSCIFVFTSAAIAFCLCVPVQPTVRFFIRRFCSKVPLWGASVLLYAEPSTAAEMFTRLHKMPERGLRPKGILLRPEQYWTTADSQVDNTIPVFDARDAVSHAVESGATWVMIDAHKNIDRAGGTSVAASLCAIPNRVVLAAPGLEFGIWDQVHAIGSACGIRLSGGRPSLFCAVTKRFTDITVAIVVGLFLLPFLVLASCLIYASSPGPVLYGQERVGRSGRRFKAWKFRTMRVDADAVLQQYLAMHPELRAEWESTRKLKNDPRVTGIGRFLRKTSLDELPQLWNIVVGDMSLVGPRPIVDSPLYDGKYITDYPEEFSAYKTMRPGLTGLWQVTCRNSAVYEMRIFWDVHYIRNWSLWLDWHILLRTVRTVLLREGAF